MKYYDLENNQNGRSMIEMLGVLAIIGVLSVGGIAGYSKAMMKYRTNKTIEQITLTLNNIKTFFANQKGDNKFDSMSYGMPSSGICSSFNRVIRKAKLMPDEMLLETVENLIGSLGTAEWACYINAFGGSVQFYGDSKNTITLMFNGLPAEASIEIATQDWSALEAEKIGINARMGFETNWYRKETISVDEAIAKCNKEYNSFVIAIK